MGPSWRRFARLAVVLIDIKIDNDNDCRYREARMWLYCLDYEKQGDVFATVGGRAEFFGALRVKLEGWKGLLYQPANPLHPILGRVFLASS